MGHTFLDDDIFLVFISFSLIWMVLVPMNCFRLVPFLKAIMGSVLKIFLQVLQPVICASVLEYFLNLVTLDFMLLIMVCIVYHDGFVGAVVVFDRVGQFSEFAV